MRIFITGASRGLGLALAKRFLNDGHWVVGIGRSEFDKQLIAEKLQSQFSYYRCDMTIPDQVDRVYDSMIQNGFSPDVVVFNAAIMADDMGKNGFNFEKFQEIMEVNLTAQIRWLSKIIPIFQKNNRGIFIGISSLSSLRAAVKNKVGYPASKAALNMVFEALRIQLTLTNIRFITANLGPLENAGGCFTASYAQAANKVAEVIKSRRNILYFPKIPFLISYVLKYFPDGFVYHILTKFEK